MLSIKPKVDILFIDGIQMFPPPLFYIIKNCLFFNLSLETMNKFQNPYIKGRGKKKQENYA